MTIEQAREFIATHRWQTSKDGSHQYTVIDWPGCDRAAFLAVAAWIREEGAGGYFGRFQGHRYRYMDIDGMQYWTMGWPLDNTQVLNRAKKPA